MLTAKQRRFIESYDGNATQAAIKAGYSRKTAYSIGQENLKKPELRAAIQEREYSRLDELIATREERLRFYTQIMRDENESTKYRLKAAELLDKAGCNLEKNNDFSPWINTMEILRKNGL